MADNKFLEKTIDDPALLLSIKGREKLVPYFGPIPVRDSLIAFEDGRSLKVLEIIYRARMPEDRDELIINGVIIATRFV